MADIDWEARIKKWEDWHIDDPDKATADELTEYVDTMLYVFSQERYTDGNLWYVFWECFQNFTRTTFNRLRHSQLLRLRHFLRCASVYVKQNYKSFTIAQSLVELLNEWDKGEE